MSSLTDQDQRLFTAKEAARFLRLSVSWLAKARMRGDGPPYFKPGRAVRYREGGLIEWLKSRSRSSTSEISTRDLRGRGNMV